MRAHEQLENFPKTYAIGGGLGRMICCSTPLRDGSMFRSGKTTAAFNLCGVPY